MKISELEHQYDTICEFVDYKGVSYGFTVKKLNYVQMMWLLTSQTKEKFEKEEEEVKTCSEDMDKYCDKIDANNAKDMCSYVRYIESWCFEEEPTEHNITLLYTKRDDVAIGIMEAMLRRYMEVLSSSRKLTQEVKKK